MYAIVETGGKQYRAAQGDILEVEKLDGEVGSTITLNKVLMISGEGVEPKIGSPAIANATVTGEVLEQGRHKTVIVFKKNYRRT